MRLDYRTGNSSWIVALLALLVTFAAVQGATDVRPGGRFDQRVQSRVGGAIGAEARALAELDPADPLRSGWEEFDARNGGGWKVFVDGRTGLPTLVSGRGIEWFPAEELAGIELASLEARARSFLDRHESLFGDWKSILELDTAASLELRPGHWQLIFRQVVDGVRVENARLDFHVNQGRLVMLGASLWGLPRTSGLPSVDAGAARASLDAHLEVSTAGFEQVGDPELTMILVDPTGATGERTAWTGVRGEGLDHALIWRFRFRVPDEAALWVGEVDAHDGELLAFYDGAHYAAARGGVFPISNDGDCADGGCEIASFPLPFMDYTESGQVEEYGDAFGNMQCVDSMAAVETNLSGQYVRIVDACGALSESGSCEAGIELGRKAGEDCDVAPGASPGNSAAARTAYYHINRVAEAARFYDPANTWLQDQLTVNVNGAGTCNAFWQNGTVNMYAGGNGCGNTGELAGVLVHEWGHGYDENDGGGFDITSEAYADVVAIFATRDSCVSRGWYNEGQTCTGYGDACLNCTGIRDHDWAARERNTPATPMNWIATCPSGGGGACSRESHCEAYPIGEAIYDLATRDLPASGLDADTSWQLAERLWYETRPGSGGDIFDCFRLHLTHSCFAISWFQRMLAADDDDGDLSNGTPHAAALFAAFDRHDISCGNAGDDENQSSSSCPTLAAPVLAVTETPTGTDLFWGAVANAAEYRVYRGDLGCDRQQVPIATIPAGTTSFLDTLADPDLPRHYRVEAFGSNHACHSPVSNCESTPLQARLQMEGHRVVEDGSDGNGDGFPEPGETIRVPLTLLNGGVETANDVNGTLSLVDPTQGDVIDAQATWAALDPTASGESEAPHFEVAIAESTSCGEALVFRHDSSASNDVTRSTPFEIVLGDALRDFRNVESQAIPPETTQPVTSMLLLDQDQTVVDLEVSVRISHQESSELIVELTSPAATTVRLHDQSAATGSGLDFRYDSQRPADGPGSMNDFDGESTQGVWTLSVQDVGPLSSGDGTLVEWTLHATVSGGFDCQPAACADAVPTEAAGALVVSRSTSGPDVDLVFSWSAVAGSAGYHVLQSTAAAFDAGVVQSGSTAGALTFTLPNGANTTPDLTFFQVRAVNSCDQQGP